MVTDDPSGSTGTCATSTATLNPRCGRPLVGQGVLLHAAVPDGLAALSAVVVWVWSAGRHAVSQRHPDCLSTTCKHAVESFGFFGIDRVGVAVHPDQPNQTSTGSWIHLAPCRVVMNQGHCIRERIPGLPLCPVDDLENVSSGHVVGVSPPIRGFWATAVQVDPESGARIFPSGIALIDLYNLNLAHGRQSCSRRPKPPHIDMRARRAPQGGGGDAHLKVGAAGLVLVLRCGPGDLGHWCRFWRRITPQSERGVRGRRVLFEADLNAVRRSPSTPPDPRRPSARLIRQWQREPRGVGCRAPSGATAGT